jgi:hypothetical protein
MLLLLLLGRMSWGKYTNWQNRMLWLVERAASLPDVWDIFMLLLFRLGGVIK